MTLKQLKVGIVLEDGTQLDATVSGWAIPVVCRAIIAAHDRDEIIPLVDLIGRMNR